MTAVFPFMVIALVAALAATIAVGGILQALAGLLAVWRFCARPANEPDWLPPVTVLKPLHGDEPLLEDALASFCMQSYPDYQIVFGLQNPVDPALDILNRLRERFPRLDMTVVVDPTPHGSNRKIGNLINMLPSAKHDTLVISDSDIHAEPDYLRHVVTALNQPGTGLATTLYSGLPANDSVAAQLAATQINHAFLPGVMMARLLGRQACLGATMALRRETLEAVGGLHVLRHQVADDAILGQLVNQVGQSVRVAASVPRTTVPENDAVALFRHELRWSRTTRSLAPVGFALSAMQYPLFWAPLAVLLSGGASWAIMLFLLCWAARALTAIGINNVLRLSTSVPIWLLPFRDMLSVAELLWSYGGDNVHWRGHQLSVASSRLAQGES